MRFPFTSPVPNKPGRIVLVTGAGGGIGRAIALRQAAAGDIVVATDIDLAAAEQTVALADGACAAYRLDVTDAGEWQGVVDRVISRFGVPDVLVNNAGIAVAGGAMVLCEEDWHKIFAVNVMSIVHGSTLVAAKMIEQGKPGQIVCTVSGAAWTPNRAAPSYSMSKAAALMVAESLRTESRSSNIGVSAICPGVTRTNLAGNATLVGTVDAHEVASSFQTIQDRFAFATPDRVARAVQRSIRSNRAIVPVNFDAKLAWVLHRLSPGLMRAICSIPTMKLAESSARVALDRVPDSLRLHRD